MANLHLTLVLNTNTSARVVNFIFNTSKPTQKRRGWKKTTPTILYQKKQQL